MMIAITRKPEITTLTQACIDTFHAEGVHACVACIQKSILDNKVKFPLLEHCAKLLYEHLPEEVHIAFCDKVEELKTIGGNVLLGIILQQRMGKHYRESIDKATEYISMADAWYVCDIIGERVFGVGLLQYTTKTMKEVKRLSGHEANWVVRSLGAGTHYAIKKGLPAEHVDTLFTLLLSMATTKDKEIKQGVGWAAKTTAKFHPHIIDKYQEQIDDKEKVAQWFRTKIAIGLNRNNYAKRG